MARLTQKQRASIERALYHAMRAEKYLFRADTAVCAIGEARYALSGPQGDYLRAGDSKSLRPMAKEYGSDLCGLHDAVKELAALLAPEPGTVEAH